MIDLGGFLLRVMNSLDENFLFLSIVILKWTFTFVDVRGIKVEKTLTLCEIPKEILQFNPLNNCFQARNYLFSFKTKD